MIDWRKIQKTDAHVHVLPREVLEAFPDWGGEFSHAKAESLIRIMDSFHVRRSVIMPLNDPFLMSMDFSVEAVHRNLAEICREYPDRLAAFADVDTRNTPELSCSACEAALDDPCFRGIKIHATNTGVAIDDPYYDRVLTMAERRGAPVAFHSYPNRLKRDVCAPSRIARVLERHPDLTVIVCHLGGPQWRDAAKLDAYFDMSAVLPDYVLKYGDERCGEILSIFPVDRLLFATDWPCSRSCQAADIHQRYFQILNQLDLSPEDASLIAGGNLERLLWGASAQQ